MSIATEMIFGGGGVSGKMIVKRYSKSIGTGAQEGDIPLQEITGYIPIGIIGHKSGDYRRAINTAIISDDRKKIEYLIATTSTGAPSETIYFDVLYVNSSLVNFE